VFRGSGFYVQLVILNMAISKLGRIGCEKKSAWKTERENEVSEPALLNYHILTTD